MPEAIYVESDRTPDNKYVATIHFSEDVSMPLDLDAAIGYAVAVINAAARAEYEAMVAAQVLKHGSGDREMAASILLELRDAQPDLEHAKTRPVKWTPIISARDLRPYVQGHLNGQPLTQWTPDLARQHAMQVLECAVTAPIDNAYMTVLTDTVGVPVENARAAVHGLREEREAFDA